MNTSSETHESLASFDRDAQTAIEPRSGCSSAHAEAIYTFTTLEEVRNYRSGETIECLVCGRRFRRIEHSHLVKHGLDVDTYRERFGIPWSYSLTSFPSRRKSALAVSPAAIEAINRARGRRTEYANRPPSLATRRIWRKNADAGWNASSRKRVVVPCSGGCGSRVETTALKASLTIFCDDCLSHSALNKRRKSGSSVHVVQYATAEPQYALRPAA
jgi:predicted transcriptional regulator